MHTPSVSERLQALLRLDAEETPDSESCDSRLGLDLNHLVNRYNDIDLRKFTSGLVGLLRGPDGYQERLDQGLRGLVQLTTNTTSQEDVVRREHTAMDIIKRLPKTLSPTTFTTFLRHFQYFKAQGVEMTNWEAEQDAVLASGSDSKYFELKSRQDEELLSALVADWPMGTNTLVLSLVTAESIECPNLQVAQSMQRYVSFLGDLGAIVPARTFHMTKDDKHDVDLHLEIPLEVRQEILTIWDIYVSISWQQARLLLYYYILGAFFRYGWNEAWASLLDVSTIYDNSHHLKVKQPIYLCSQALELFHRSKGSIRQYSPTLFRRFGTIFANVPGRCDLNEPSYCCDGDNPRSCARFHGQSTPDQFMHDMACQADKCCLVTWNEESYDQVNGGSRAVDIRSKAAIGEQKQLLYCQADENTLAISHVWSHGQGGRPETGINSCLHARYTTIARAHDCSSYWIDTCCIPTDDGRRMEAIRGINGVFMRSKITLVCDKDIMTVTADSSEDVLSVLLVADWNVRAWTLLEGLRGRDNLHLLCASNAIVSFSALCRDVFENGAIDLVAHLTSVQHLLPKFTLSYEESGFMLGRRTASRAGDETIIWGLMSVERATKSAEDIYKHLDRVRTGFLMSSLPRIKGARLSWAPSVAHDNDNFSGSDGDGSEVATIQDDGLHGRWLVHHIDNTPKNHFGHSMDPFYRVQSNLELALSGFNFPGEDCPPGAEYRHLILIHAKSVDSDKPYFGRNQIHAWRLVALCGSNDRLTWKWLEALNIDTNLAKYPVFAPQKILGLDDFQVETIVLV